FVRGGGTIGVSIRTAPATSSSGGCGR
ncbi:hypothetical protein A2U01_0088251, partial [Trifolium medium]|nr:hypothetical protein [Trifolium medium]